MDLIQIYECLCDRTRLRILHLLTRSPLCVCHFQDILGEPQVKISKHLGYLRHKGMVATKREQNWIIYSLPERRADELERNLKCLQDCVQTDAVFKRDVEALLELGIDISKNTTQRVFDVWTSGQIFQFVVTVCSEVEAEGCPIFAGVTTRLHWPFDDPSKFTGAHEERLEKTRRVRDQIRARIDSFCEEHCVASKA